MTSRLGFQLALLWVVATHQLQFANGQEFTEKFEHWPLETSIVGTVVLAQSPVDLGSLTNAVRPPDKDAVIRVYTPESSKNDAMERVRQLFDGIAITATGFDEQSDFRKDIAELAKDCKILCWFLDKKLDKPVRKNILECQQVLGQFTHGGGRLFLIGSIASLAGKTGPATKEQTGQSGLNLIPDAVLYTSFEGSDRPRLLSQLRSIPRSVGIGLPQHTTLVISRRVVRIFGSEAATFLLPAGPHHEVRSAILGEQISRRQRPPEYLLDWTEWRRDSIDRTLDAFPPRKPERPNVKNGTLLIVGGGGMPKGLMREFVELAGGVENAKLVYIPCSESPRVSSRQGTVSAWRRMGVKHATHIHTKNRHKANTDEEFLAPLKEATGIWFGGGRQWNFADSYYGTQAHKLMKDVLKRGGVIGGSSAGASVQARYLARATPIENFRIMAPGYERGGLGFISGVAIDQHFSQRGRQKDMTQLVNRYPQMLGLGIDEGTALVVQKSRGEVVGKGKVFFYDRRQPLVDGKPDYISLPAGSSYNLADRTIIVDTTHAKNDKPSDEDSE